MKIFAILLSVGFSGLQSPAVAGKCRSLCNQQILQARRACQKSEKRRLRALRKKKRRCIRKVRWRCIRLCRNIRRHRGLCLQRCKNRQRTVCRVQQNQKMARSYQKSLTCYRAIFGLKSQCAQACKKSRRTVRGRRSWRVNRLFKSTLATLLKEN